MEGHRACGDSSKSFHELADEAFADLLKKHKQSVGLKLRNNISALAAASSFLKRTPLRA